MSDFWDITDEDITIVIASHKAKATIEVARRSIDEDKIIANLRQFSDFADQVSSASSDVDQLMAVGIIPRRQRSLSCPRSQPRPERRA